jgi:hypothetical protein
MMVGTMNFTFYYYYYNEGQAPRVERKFLQTVPLIFTIVQ